MTTNTTASSVTTTIGPIKTDASRKYYRRISSEYQDHAMRRQLYHHRHHLPVEPNIQEGEKDRETMHVAEALEQLRETSVRAADTTSRDGAMSTDEGQQAIGGDEVTESLSRTQYGSPIQVRRAQHKPPLTISTDFKAGVPSSVAMNTTTKVATTPAAVDATPKAAAFSPPHHQTAAKSVDLPTVLNIPFPNLTLTLALIYVDRLKSKYPEARGEAGCSHRLFLVAYIIAAKYRCSVELAHLASQLKEMEIEQELELERRQRILERGSQSQRNEDTDYDADEMRSRMTKKPKLDRSNHDDDEYNNTVGDRRRISMGAAPSDPSTEEWKARQTAMEKRLEQAEKLADLVFSNHAWTRLLNFGIFSLSPPVTPSAVNQSNTSTTTTTAIPAAPSTPHNHQHDNNNTHSSNATNTSNANNNSASNVTVLQVEDLDRMEVEFLTFLNCDLSALSHDLQTCWNLLVGA
ncbi:hypothetical protein DFQ26_007915 [Actinomortierella ambigua]|nr:hypothetical protein DFQ26_007915 [Actinomortierella ambigua]